MKALAQISNGYIYFVRVATQQTHYLQKRTPLMTAYTTASIKDLKMVYKALKSNISGIKSFAECFREFAKKHYLAT